MLGLPVFYWFGAHAKLYLAVTIILTAPILEMCVFMLRESKLSKEDGAKAYVFSLLMGSCVIAEFRSRDAGDIFSLMLAGVMALFGMCMLLAKSSRPVTFGTLGTAYLALSTFYFMYLINKPDLDETAKWLPTLLGIAAFGWIALKGGDRAPYASA